MAHAWPLHLPYLISVQCISITSALIWLVQACSRCVFQAGRTERLPTTAYGLAVETHIDTGCLEAGESERLKRQKEQKKLHSSAQASSASKPLFKDVCIYATSLPIPICFSGAAQEENLISCLLPLPVSLSIPHLSDAKPGLSLSAHREGSREKPGKQCRHRHCCSIIQEGWRWPLAIPCSLHHGSLCESGDAGGVPKHSLFRATHEAAGQSWGQSLHGPFKFRNSSAFSCSNCSLTASGFWQFLAALSVMYCQDFNKGLPQTYLLLQLQCTPLPRRGQGLDCGGVQGWENCSFGGLFPV